MDRKVKNLLMQSVKCLKEKDFISAEKKLHGAMNIEPSNYLILYNLGVTYLGLKRLDFAKKYFVKSINLNSKYFPSMFNLGVLLSKYNEFSEAERVLMNAITLRPNYYKSYEKLGDLYKSHKRSEDALNSYKKAIEIQPVGVRLILVAVLCHQNRKLDEAEIYYGNALKISPTYSLHNLGLLLKQKGALSEAEVLLRRLKLVHVAQSIET